MLLACQVGCSVCQQARRTLIIEPSEYSWRYDRRRSVKAYRQWADEAWARENGGCPAGTDLDEYALGFRDGFVDYVYAGGTGEPPPVPPRKFWNVAWRTPPGFADAEQWFAGYRHGAQSARNGGYREGGIAHSSFAGSGGAWVEGELPTPAPEELGAPAEVLPPPPEDAEGAYDGLTLPEPPSPQIEGDAPLDGEVDGAPALDMPVEGDAIEPAAPIETAPPEVVPSASQRFRRALSVAKSDETSDPQ